MNKLIEKIVERLRSLKKPRYGIGFEYITIDDAISIIQEEAEACKGEWKFDISGAGHYNCSVCGGRGDFYGKYNYCPHCGSQMKEDVEAKAYNESVETNADRIRGMSDEELEKYIIHSGFCPASAQKESCYHSDDDTECSGCIKKWLQSEVQ